MIHIKRTSSTAKVLTDKRLKSTRRPGLTRADLECEKAIEYYTVTLPAEQAKVKAKNAQAALNGGALLDSPKIKFPFSVYGDEHVVKELMTLFHKKCAYCESHFRHVTPADIEHFRPKGAVIINGSLEHPGYYWLGADWDNLFLSCPRCNRKDQLDVPGVQSTVSGGKGNHFPLLDESKRVRKHGLSLADEEAVRLLLNPCIDDPEAVLRYEDDGSILPKRRLRKLNRRRADTSISVYGLWQGELRDKRKELLDQLKLELITIERFLRMIDRMKSAGESPADIQTEQDVLDMHMGVLKGMFEPGAEYLGMLRYQLRQELEPGRAGDRLVRVGLDLTKLLV
ncbi:retron system putative HNH endonuclease [Acidovorax sp. Leaf78]|uniref:retron system putative HNH endonuclease n=1 Tax=Acidovorax sp. Leaf78 TaxID=1736237 RepID=UPI0006FD1486|nr:retron system putative HNH endonuclease [Acidovorax sp. Leaf78]KQO27225.1 hypothetical protein ASF16_19680 [Acidovorax sp. Leaf78]